MPWTRNEPTSINDDVGLGQLQQNRANNYVKVWASRWVESFGNTLSSRQHWTVSESMVKGGRGMFLCQAPHLQWRRIRVWAPVPRSFGGWWLNQHGWLEIRVSAWPIREEREREREKLEIRISAWLIHEERQKGGKEKVGVAEWLGHGLAQYNPKIPQIFTLTPFSNFFYLSHQILQTNPCA